MTSEFKDGIIVLVERDSYMYFKVGELAVKNFCSYGNAEMRFSYKEGLNLITAKNGGGKSAFFLDALCYNLYGKPYRDIKISELTNRKNKKGMYTEGIYFPDSTTKIKIVRTPQKLEIFKNDSVEPMKSSSSKLIDQEEINSLIGIDHQIFKLIIAVATNTNEPFLSLGLPKKREVMESIFSIKIFGEMLKKARTKLISLKTEKTIIQNNLKTQESSLISSKKQLDEIEKSIKEFETNKENEVSELLSRKETLQNSIEQLEKEIFATKERLNSIILDEVDYNSKLVSLESSIKIEENTIKEKKNILKFLEKNAQCPLCNHELTDDHKQKEISNINSIIEKSQKKIETNKKSLITLSEKISKQKNTKNSYDNLNTQISMNTMKKSNSEKSLKEFDNQIQSVQSRVLNIDLESLKSDYSTKINIYRKDADSLEKINNDLKKYEIVVKMFSEDGIKSYFLKRLIPILNKMINEYLSKFDIPIMVNFDATMQESISIIGSSEKDISYNSFSEGEKKRIDIAILLSFIDTMKKISNWNCNLLIFDEILDSATDSDGLEKLLTSIKDMTLNDNQLCAYVISHREAFQDLYTSVVTVKKAGGFSKIEVK